MATHEYVRMTTDANGDPLALETSTISFVPAQGESGVQVDFIGAVHLGDPEYYEDLNRQFDDYDVVLYELVANPDKVQALAQGQTAESSHFAGMIQKMMARFLGLQHQLNNINYSKANFVHADFTADQLAKEVKNRDFLMQILTEIWNKMTNPSSASQTNVPGLAAQLQQIFTSKDPAHTAKVLMAKVLGDSTLQEFAMGKATQAVIIEARNQEALKVLSRELAKGHKKIGIFYGAGHGPDFERRLVKEFGLKPVNQSWLTAWDLRA